MIDHKGFSKDNTQNGAYHPGKVLPEKNSNDVYTNY